MAQWFEVKVKYDRNTSDGSIKSTTESYLVDALSYTEVEERITEEMQAYVSGEFKIESARRVRVSEIFFNEGCDRWYRAKVAIITIDERKGVEKRTNCNMYVQASDMTQALDNLKEGMKGSMCDYVIAAITETALYDVFKEDLGGAKAE